MAVEFTLNLGNAIVSLVGAALGGIVGFLSARRISDRNAKATASAKLRAVFAPWLAKLDMALTNSVAAVTLDDDIRSAIPDHAAAVEEFCPFVDCCKRDAYRITWNDYYRYASSIYFHDHKERMKTMSEKINAILRFAET